ncbi:Flp family type IVb pilin [Oligoflexia bacterium]|nr:Flp family type IVb pilin [Oligoflexia bacterium]
MKRLIQDLKSSNGATIVEYALLVSFIAIVCIASTRYLGEEIDWSFQNAAQAISGGSAGTTGG